MPTPFRYSSIIATLCLVLSGCDPEFRSTSSQCSVASGASTSVTVPVDPDTSEVNFVASAQSDSNTYKLYLEDIIEALQPAATETLTDAEKEAIDTFLQFINGSSDNNQFNLGYEIQDGETTSSDMLTTFLAGGEVLSSNNVLEYMESIISSLDPDTQNGLFQEALELINNAIGRNGNEPDLCPIRNLEANVVVDGNVVSNIDTQVSFFNDPFIPRVDQVVAVDLQVEDPDDASQLLSVPFIGSTFINPDNFTPEGFSLPDVRQFRVNTADRTRNLLVDDDFEERIGEIEIATFNSFCEDDGGNVVECPVGTMTRTPAKSQCADPDETDERNRNEERTIALNTNFTDNLDSSINDGYKRIRLETDFVTNEVRVYASTYVTAIEDSDGMTVIEDPTNCETQAVLNELIEAAPNEVIIISNVPDPNYDIFELDNGSTNVPTPIYTFIGTSISGR